MKKLVFLVALATFVLTGCVLDPKTPSVEEMYNSYVSETGGSSSSVSKSENSVPSVGKCELILENWCRSYFDECFNGVEYKMNSLTVDDISYDDNVINISGLHSIKGAFGENYNDLAYEAQITCKEGEYEVFFNRKKAIGGWQSATRNISL